MLLTNDNAMEVFGALCFVIIGIGMYQGRSELVSEAWEPVRRRGVCSPIQYRDDRERAW